MKVFMVATVGCGLLVASALADEKSAPKAEKGAPKAEPDFKELATKASYNIGAKIGKSMKSQSVEFDVDAFVRGVRDGVSGKPVPSDQEMQQIMIQFAQAVNDRRKKEGDAFLAENKKKPGIVTTASGLQYQVLKEGTGKTPTPGDTVTVNYEGRLLDGTVFDSTYQSGKPQTFGVTQVIKGWTEALQLMKVGSKYKIFIPSELAYGVRPPNPNGPIRPNDTLVFEVELLEVK